MGESAPKLCAWECFPYYPWGHGQGRNDLPLPPIITLWESWPCGHKNERAVPDSHQLQHLGKKALNLGNTMEPIVLLKVWMSQLQSSEKGRALPIMCLYCGAMDGESCLPPTSSPSMLEAGERADHVVIRVGELSLTPTSCNTWKSRAWT